jgi:hypothetical protein
MLFHSLICTVTVFIKDKKIYVGPKCVFKRLDLDLMTKQYQPFHFSAEKTLCL